MHGRKHTHIHILCHRHLYMMKGTVQSRSKQWQLLRAQPWPSILFVHNYTTLICTVCYNRSSSKGKTGVQSEKIDVTDKRLWIYMSKINLYSFEISIINLSFFFRNCNWDGRWNISVYIGHFCWHFTNTEKSVSSSSFVSFFISWI